jgi:hypothetical protein
MTATTVFPGLRGRIVNSPIDHRSGHCPTQSGGKMTEFPQTTSVPPPTATDPITPYQSPPSVAAYIPSDQESGSADHASGDASAKEKASAAAEAGKQGVGDVAQTATDKAKDVTQETSRQARNLVGEARNQLTEQASSQQRGLATNLRSLGNELGSMADRSDQSGLATDLVVQARDRVHDVAGWLEGREPADLLDEVREFARRRPGTFLVGALIAGVVAGRLTRGVIASHNDNEAQQRASGTGDAQMFSDYPQGSGYATSQPAPYAQGADYPQTPVSYASEGVGNGSAPHGFGNDAEKLGFGGDPR